MSDGYSCNHSDSSKDVVISCFISFGPCRLLSVFDVWNVATIARREECVWHVKVNHRNISRLVRWGMVHEMPDSIRIEVLWRHLYNLCESIVSSLFIL